MRARRIPRTNTGHARCLTAQTIDETPMTQIPPSLPFSLVPLTDKLSREPTDHPDRIPVDRRSDPITRRLRVLVRRSLNDRPN